MDLDAYINEIATLLKTRYGIDAGDVGLARDIARREHDAGITPEEAVQMFERKYDLERIDINPFSISMRKKI